MIDQELIRRRFAALSTAELIRVVSTEREEYQPEAIALAEEELRRRREDGGEEESKNEQPGAGHEAGVKPLSPVSGELPRIWIGYLLAIALLLLELYESATDQKKQAHITLWDLAIALAGVVYWLYCMHRFSTIIWEAEGGSEEAKPKRRYLLPFVAFHNFKWIIEWPAQVSNFANTRMPGTPISRRWLGTLFLLGVLLMRFDTAVGLFTLFSIGAYVRKRMTVLLASVPTEYA